MPLITTAPTHSQSPSRGPLETHQQSILDSQLNNCYKNLRTLALKKSSTTQLHAQKRLTIAELQAIWTRFDNSNTQAGDGNQIRTTVGIGGGVTKQMLCWRYVETGEKIYGLKGMHSVARAFCFEKVINALSTSKTIDRTHHGQNGGIPPMLHVPTVVGAAPMTDETPDAHILRLRSELDIVLCCQQDLYLQDPFLGLIPTANSYMQLLRRLCSVIHECFKDDRTTSLALNGIQYAKNMIDLLIGKGYQAQALDFVMWLISGVEACISFISASYLSERVELYHRAFQCYSLLGEYVHAKAFVSRCVQKIKEVDVLERKSFGKTGIDQDTLSRISEAQDRMTILEYACNIVALGGLPNEPSAATTGIVAASAKGEGELAETVLGDTPITKPGRPRRFSVINGNAALPVIEAEQANSDEVNTEVTVSLLNKRIVEKSDEGINAGEAIETVRLGEGIPDKDVTVQGESTEVPAVEPSVDKYDAISSPKVKGPVKRKKMQKPQMNLSYEDAAEAFKRRQTIVSTIHILNACSTPERKLGVIIQCLKSLAGCEVNMVYQDRISNETIERDRMAYHLLDISYALLASPEDLTKLASLTSQKMTLVDDATALRIKLSQEEITALIESRRGEAFQLGDLTVFARMLFRFGQWDRFKVLRDILQSLNISAADAKSSIILEMDLRFATTTFLRNVALKRKVLFDSEAKEAAPLGLEIENQEGDILEAQYTSFNKLVGLLQTFADYPSKQLTTYGALLSDTVNVLWSFCEPILCSVVSSSQVANHPQSAFLGVPGPISNALKCMIRILKLLPNSSTILFSAIALKSSLLFEHAKLPNEQADVLLSAIDRIRDTRQQLLACGGTLASATCDPTLYSSVEIDDEEKDDEERLNQLRDLACVEVDVCSSLFRVKLKVREDAVLQSQRNKLHNRRKPAANSYVSPGSSEGFLGDQFELECGANTQLRALYCICYAMDSVTITRGSRLKLLQEACALLKTARAKEAQLLRAIYQQRKKIRPVDAEQPFCLPPVLVRRRMNSVTLRPQPMRNEDSKNVQPYWYKVFCAQHITGTVSLNDVDYPGTGQLRRFRDDMEITVSGLTPFNTYYFALAAYTEDGSMIGDSIGSASVGIVTMLPLPLLLLWGYLGKVAAHYQFEEEARVATSVLWQHYIRSVVTDEQLAKSHSSKLKKVEAVSWCRYYELRMDLAAPSVLKLFAQNIMAVLAWDEEQLAVFNDMAGSRAVSVAQISRLQLCRNMMIALEISLRMKDGQQALSIVKRCHDLLAPMMRFDIQSSFLINSLKLCHETITQLHRGLPTDENSHIAKILPSLTFYLVSAASRCRDVGTVEKLVSTTLDYLGRLAPTHTIPKILSNPLLEAIYFKGVLAPKKIRYQSTKNAEFTEFQHHTHLCTTSNRGLLYRDAKLSDTARFTEGLQMLQVEASHSRTDKLVLEPTTTMKDVFQLMNTGRDAVYQELMNRFKRHPRLTELVAHVVQQSYRQGEYELVGKICNGFSDFLHSRTDAILKSEIDNEDDKKDKSTPKRKKRNMFTDKRAMYSITNKKVLASNVNARKMKNMQLSFAARAKAKRAHGAKQHVDPMTTQEVIAFEEKTRQDAARNLQELLSERWKIYRYRQHLRHVMELEAPWRCAIIITHAKSLQRQISKRLERTPLKLTAGAPSIGMTGHPVSPDLGNVVSMPVVREVNDKDEDELTSMVLGDMSKPAVLEILQLISQASVIAGREKLWLQLQEACREMWNTTSLVLQHNLGGDNFGNQFLWRAFSTVAPYIIDFLYNAKLERILSTSSTTVDKKYILFSDARSNPKTHIHWRYLQTSQLSATWYGEDDVMHDCLVDLGWYAQFITYTISHLFQSEHYHRVISLADSFNEVTGYAYEGTTAEYVEKAQLLLREQGEVFSRSERKRQDPPHLQRLRDCRGLVSLYLTRTSVPPGSNPRSNFNEVVSAYLHVLRDANSVDDRLTAAIACSELGDFFFESGDVEAAAVYWSKTVDALFSKSRVVEFWREIVQKSLPYSNMIHRLGGTRHCYLAAIALHKMAQYSYFGHIDKQLELCLFSAQLCVIPLCVSLPHPQDPVMFAKYVPTQLFPGFELLSEAHVFRGASLVDCLEYITKKMTEHSFCHDALPVLSFLEYVCTDILQNVPYLICVRIRKVNALISLGMFVEAITLLTDVYSGNAIPQSKRVVLGIKPTSSKLTYNSTEPVSSINNSRVVKLLADHVLAESIGLYYGRNVVEKVETCRANLIITLVRFDQSIAAADWKAPTSSLAFNKPAHFKNRESSKSNESLLKGTADLDISVVSSISSVATTTSSTGGRRPSALPVTKKGTVEVSLLLDRAEQLLNSIIVDIVNEHSRTPTKPIVTPRLDTLARAYHHLAESAELRKNVDMAIKIMLSTISLYKHDTEKEPKNVERTEGDVSRGVLLRWGLSVMDWMIRQGHFQMAGELGVILMQEARTLHYGLYQASLAHYLLVCNTHSSTNQSIPNQKTLVANLASQIPFQTYDLASIMSSSAQYMEASDDAFALLSHANILVDSLTRKYSLEERLMYMNVWRLSVVVKYQLGRHFENQGDVEGSRRQYEQARTLLSDTATSDSTCLLPLLVKLANATSQLRHQNNEISASRLFETSSNLYQESLELVVQSGGHDHEIIISALKGLFQLYRDDTEKDFCLNVFFMACVTIRMRYNLNDLSQRFEVEKSNIKDSTHPVYRDYLAWNQQKNGSENARVNLSTEDLTAIQPSKVLSQTFLKKDDLTSAHFVTYYLDMLNCIGHWSDLPLDPYRLSLQSKIRCVQTYLRENSATFANECRMRDLNDLRGDSLIPQGDLVGILWFSTVHGQKDPETGEVTCAVLLKKRPAGAELNAPKEKKSGKNVTAAGAETTNIIEISLRTEDIEQIRQDINGLQQYSTKIMAAGKPKLAALESLQNTYSSLMGAIESLFTSCSRRLIVAKEYDLRQEIGGRERRLPMLNDSTLLILRRLFDTTSGILLAGDQAEFVGWILPVLVGEADHK